MTYLEECIRKHLTKVENKIAKGKGVWPKPGNIKDDDWAPLRHTLQDAGLKYEIT